MRLGADLVYVRLVAGGVAQVGGDDGEDQVPVNADPDHVRELVDKGVLVLEEGEQMPLFRQPEEEPSTDDVVPGASEGENGGQSGQDGALSTDAASTPAEPGEPLAQVSTPADPVDPPTPAKKVTSARPTPPRGGSSS